MVEGTKYEPLFMCSILSCPGTPKVLLWFWPPRAIDPLHCPCRVASQKKRWRHTRTVVVWSFWGCSLGVFWGVSGIKPTTYKHRLHRKCYVNTEGCFYILANEFWPVWIRSHNYLTQIFVSQLGWCYDLSHFNNSWLSEWTPRTRKDTQWSPLLSKSDWAELQWGKLSFTISQLLLFLPPVAALPKVRRAKASFGPCKPRLRHQSVCIRPKSIGPWARDG